MLNTMASEYEADLERQCRTNPKRSPPHIGRSLDNHLSETPQSFRRLNTAKLNRVMRVNERKYGRAPTELLTSVELASPGVTGEHPKSLEDADNRAFICNHKTTTQIPTRKYGDLYQPQHNAAGVSLDGETLHKQCPRNMLHTENKNGSKAVKPWNHYLLVHQTGFELAIYCSQDIQAVYQRPAESSR